MSTMDQFKDFYSKYAAAMQAGDADALRRTLPADVPGDHLEFLLQVNQSLFSEAAESGIEPEYRQDGNRFIANYHCEDEDGEETMDREFWWHEGRWVSYDPR